MQVLPMSPRLQTGGRIQLSVLGSYGNNIEGYHGLFGFPNAGRELRDRGRPRFFLENTSGIMLDEEAASDRRR
jgi:hypothetical protein